MEMNRAVMITLLLLSASRAGAELPAGTGVAGSVHDMTRLLPASFQGNACAFCHLPHRRSQSAATPSAATRGETGVASAPAGPSRTCLACHDGAFAAEPPAGHHAVGVPYREQHSEVGSGGKETSGQARRILKPTSSEFPGTGGVTVGERLWQSGDGAADALVTCSTCHDVHNKGGEAPGKNYLLVVSDRASLCSSCHEQAAASPSGEHAGAGE